MIPTLLPDARERALVKLGAALRDLGYRFTTITPETHRRVNARPENRVARRLEDIFGWSRDFHQGLLPNALIDLMHEAEVIAPADDGWRSLVRLSTMDEFFLFHSCYPTQAADAVFFGPDTYRFAAALAERVKSLTGSIKRAVDIGCGTGAGGIVAARALSDATIVMGDINTSALKLARVNAALNQIENVQVTQSDMLSSVDGTFDLIFANPPYLVDPAGRSYRNGGGELGAALSVSILETAIDRLSPGGTLLLYTGSAIVGGRDSFQAEVSQRMNRAGFSWRYGEVDPDVFGEELDTPAYAHADRISAVVLSATKPR